MITTDTSISIAPVVPGYGHHRVVEARLRALINASPKPIEQIADETDIELSEFAEFFATGNWQIRDIVLVCDALGISPSAPFADVPSPDEMSVAKLIIWLRQAYGRSISIGAVIDEYSEADEAVAARDRWIALVYIADGHAIRAARGGITN